MMERSIPSISLICRNARLSLQKAALSRRSHMLSEELEHLRDFESLVSKTLPLHPHFSFKREQKELLELDSHLLDVRKRLAEIEYKHPFLYKHHRKEASSFHGSDSKSKRPKESHESYKPQKKKQWSSSLHTTSRPPSSLSSASSSACEKGLPAPFLSEYSRRSPPTPSKRSLSASCSRSPSLRSSASGSLGVKTLKRSLALRSPLNSVVDDAVFPSEKLKVTSHSTACRDAYDDDLRFPPHKPLLSSPDSLKHRPKGRGDVKSSGCLDPCEEKPPLFASYSSFDLDLASSDERNFKSGLEFHVNEGGFSSRMSKFPSPTNRAKCRPALQSYVDELAIPSPKAPANPPRNDNPSWKAHSLDYEDDTGKTLMEGFIAHNDSSDTAEVLVSTSFYEEMGRRKMRNLTGGLHSRGRHDSIESLTQCNDDVSLLDLAAETIHGMRASSRPSQKRPLRSKGAGKGGTHAFKTMHSSFEEVDSILDDHDSSKDSQNAIRESTREQQRSKLKTDRTLAGVAFTENLEEALKRLGSLQESDGSLEESEAFGNEKKSSSRPPYSSPVHSKMEVFKRMAIDAEQSSYAGAGSRRALFGKDESAEVQGVDFQDDQIWAENVERLEHGEDDGGNAKFEERRKLERDTDMHLEERPWGESGTSWEERALQSGDEITNEDHLQADYEVVGKDVSRVGNMGSSGMKADHKKRVKFERWATDAQLDDPMTLNSNSFVEQAQPEADGGSFNGRHFLNAGTCDASKLQAKWFVGRKNCAEHFDGEDVEGVEDSKQPFTMSHLASRAQDALSSSFSSSASCAAAPSFHCSLGRRSPPWESFEATSSNLISDELDSQSHPHQQKGASGQQRTTFCNPVFDFDGSKACSESISRSKTHSCDANGAASSPSEERLKSILGECAYVASQLNNGYGEECLDNGSKASLAGTHTNGRVPSSTVESKVRGKVLPREDVSEIGHVERESVLQVSEITKQMESFQRSLDELRETVQNSSLHVQEQVDICEAKVKGMERELKDVKLETSSELLGLKRLVKAQVDMKAQRGGSKKDVHGDGSFEERLQSNMDACSSKFDVLQKQVDSWIHVELRDQVEDAVASAMEKFGSSIKTDMEKLELQRLRDLGNLKKEMGLKLSLHESKEQLNKISEKQLDLIVEDVLGKQFSHLVAMFSAEKENELAQIKSELAYLRKEYEAHFRGRAGVHAEHAESMTHLKRQLHSIRNDGLQVKCLVDGMKKETAAHVHAVKLSIDKLQIEALECKDRISGLEKLLCAKQADPKKIVKKLYKVRTNRSPT